MADQTSRPLSPRQRAALAAAAAERVGAMLALAASTNTQRKARQVLDDLWDRLATGHAIDVAQTVHELERLPEVRGSDRDDKAYHVMEAIAAVWSAVAELRPDHPMAGEYEEVSISFMSGYDTLVHERETGRPQLMDPTDVRPPGPFEAAEIERQAADRRLLFDLDWSDALAQLRHRSQEDAYRLREDVRGVIDWAYPSR